MALIKNLKKLSGLSDNAAEDSNVFVLGTRDSRSGVEPTLKIKDDQTVLDVILAHKIPIATSCGGMGTCGTCRIEVLEEPDGLSARNEIEEEFARDRGFKDNERLACQIEACVGLKFFVPPED